MGWLGPFGMFSTPLDSQRPALQFGIWFGGSGWPPRGVKTRKTSQKSSIQCDFDELEVGKSESCQKNPKFHAEFDGAIRLAPFWVFPR